MIRPETTLASWKTVRADTAQAVRDFPPDAIHEYPIPDFMSFHELGRHVLESGHALSGMLLDGVDNMQTPEFRNMLKKYVIQLPVEMSLPDLADALESRLEERLAELRSQPDGFFLGEVTRFDGQRLTRLEMIQTIKEHELTHRAQMFMLLRMKGIVPATTRRRRAAQQK